MQWLKWFCAAEGGAHLTKPGWSKPHTHSDPTNLALFRHKITLYRFNRGGLILLQGGGLKWEQGAESPLAPSLNHCTNVDRLCAVFLYYLFRLHCCSSHTGEPTVIIVEWL